MDIARPGGCDEIRDSRGVAIADLDLDGRLDLVISNNNAGAGIYLNRLETAGHWIGLTLEGDQSNRNAVGARVLLTAGGKTQHRVVEAGSGFASQAPFALHLGVGQASRIDGLTVYWPNGGVDRFSKEKLETFIDCNLYLREGTGILKLRERSLSRQAAVSSSPANQAGGGTPQ